MCSTQQAVIEVLVNKAVRAAKEAGYCELALAGGVACNSELRRQLGEALAKEGIGLYIPSPILCTDNGAMVAAAAYRKAREGHYASGRLDVFPNLNIETQLDLLDR